MDGMMHYKVTVTGDVQGHYFRNTAQGWAANLNLKGFIQNKPDGSVYAEVEGHPDSLNRFIAQCRQGSPGCRVDNVTYTVHSPTGYTNFQVAG